ncbi:RNA demethylase ALKBH9B-like isoform X1 [Amaranthus tricolor]|uniref:RNA demethylase ALKBH9B-like isoform X1 n=2 Tax=Amaranthus tricolor TaxID=29722 RepID=UPI0025899E94|nr:RNA demethylase ALKBH9B-like isoform X1 [Amaranthus tricolor]
MTDPPRLNDPFLLRYDESELEIASEFLSNWLPFLSRDLCQNCTHNLSRRIRSLTPQHDNKGPSNSGDHSAVLMPDKEDSDFDKCDTHSLGSWKDEAETNSYGTNVCSESVLDASPSEVCSNSASIVVETPKVRMSWADMTQEDELEGDGDALGEAARKKTELSRDQREYLRFMNVRRKKDFICLERIDGKFKNILQGLELHTGVFSAVEQKRIVDCVYELEEKGKKGELKERTYTAPRKWMKGKGRVTIQFGCCYNYATDKNGNPPGILKREEVDPLPPLFKVIVKRLIRWHVLPPTCVPDSCIVNIYDAGDCIPPHIDNHDFVRPFCTISFLSVCNIVFGTDLKIVGPGEFTGSMAIPLPVGSVLVLNGNGADVAKHCVPAVPSKRISITFRRMDESKRPVYYAPEPEFVGLEPLCYDEEGGKKSPSPRNMGRQGTRGGFRSERKKDEEPRYSGRYRPSTRAPRTRVNLAGS